MQIIITESIRKHLALVVKQTKNPIMVTRRSYWTIIAIIAILTYRHSMNNKKCTNTKDAAHTDE